MTTGMPGGWRCTVSQESIRPPDFLQQHLICQKTMAYTYYIANINTNFDGKIKEFYDKNISS